MERDNKALRDRRKFVVKGVGLFSLVGIPTFFVPSVVVHAVELKFSETVTSDNYGKLCNHLMDTETFEPILKQFSSTGKLLFRRTHFSGQSAFVTMVFNSENSLILWKSVMKSQGVFEIANRNQDLAQIKLLTS